MRLVTMQSPTGQAAGILHADGTVSPLAAAGHASVIDLIESGPDAWAAVESLATAGGSQPIDGAALLPPLPRTPRNMFCVGLNYRDHFDEGKRPEGAEVPDAPVLFTKPWTCLVGHGATVDLDRAASNRVDWEAEIAVVIGKGGSSISVDDALDHVFGYTLSNDVSARDLQLEHGMFGQWYKGKSLDGFCPMGPSIVSAAEVGDYRDIEVELRVNGVQKQSFRATSMINSVPRVIARVSLGCSLLPGDIILTGTASGVGHWREPPEFLGGGDVVEIESPQLGLLRTHFTESGG